MENENSVNTNNHNEEENDNGAAKANEAAASAFIGQPPSFDHSANDQFAFFQSRLTNFFRANDITADDKMKAILTTCLSDKTFKLLSGLCHPDSPDNLSFEELFSKLCDYFNPKEVLPYFRARLSFYTARKKESESYEEWAKRIETLAAECKFTNDVDALLKDIFVIGLGHSNIRGRLLEEDPTNSETTIDYLIHLANTTEAINAADDSNKDKIKCVVCGMTNHSANDCKYKGMTCKTCGEKGHITPGCKDRVKLKSNKRQALRRYAQNAARRYLANRGGKAPDGGNRFGPNRAYSQFGSYSSRPY